MLFSIFVWIIIVFVTFFWSIIVCALGIVDMSGDLSHLSAKIWTRFICIVSRVTPEIEGLENISRDKAQIFVSNHQGFFDIFVLNTYLPVQFRWVAKNTLFKVPILGWGMKACRHISVDRTDKRKALKSFLVSVNRLQEGKSVLIFPEGTRSINETIGEFKKGALLLAVRTKLPIVPVIIQGSSDVMKRGSMRITPGKIRVVIDKPIDSGYFRGEKKEALLDAIRDVFIKNLQGVN